jgi:hypothetical protein
MIVMILMNCYITITNSYIALAASEKSLADSLRTALASRYRPHTASSFKRAPTLEEGRNILTSIRQKMHEAVRNPDHTAKPKYKFVYDCNWMLPIVLNEQFDSNQRLSDVITLTGTAQKAQAASCSEYISRIWPKAGPFLLEVLEEWLQNRGRKQSESANYTASLVVINVRRYGGLTMH